MASIGRNLEIMQAVRQVNRNLSRVAAAVESKVKPEMIAQAKAIADEMRRIAPVDEDAPNPGELKASIRVIEGEATAKKAFIVKIAAGSLKTTKGARPYNYPRAVEFGTQKMPARPFFWVIWRLRRKAARKAVRKVAVNAVREVWGDK